MAKKKTAGHDFKGLVNLLFIVFQLANIFFSMAFAEGFYILFRGSTINYAVNSAGLPEPGSVALFFPLYLLMRGLAYKICHWLGYHANANLDDTLVPPNLFGDGIAFIIPIFEKTTLAYRERYKQRRKIYQTIFYLTFVILTWCICDFTMQFCYFIFKQIQWIPPLIPFVTTAMLVMFLEWQGTTQYYKFFPWLFKLDVILVEHGQPIVGYLTPNQRMQQKMKFKR